jgi:hypothetical protein
MEEELERSEFKRAETRFDVGVQRVAYSIVSGEQQFYAFYIDVTGSSSGSNDPFQTDPTNPNGVLNVILLSRPTYLETNLSTNLSTNNLTAHLPSLATCLGSANVTARNPGGSQMGLAGTFSGSMNDSCANLLLQNLMPRNSTGNVTGTYYALNSTQVQLLGLTADTSQVVPFLAVAGYDSPMGGPPQAFSVLGAIFGTIGVGGAFMVTIGTYFHVPALVALGNFLENLPAELAAVVQVVLGVLSAVYQGVSAVVQAAMNVLYIILKLIIFLFEAAFSMLWSAIQSAASAQSASLTSPFLSLEVNNGLMSPSDYGNVTGGGTPSNNSTAYNEAGEEQNGAIAAVAVVLAITIALTITAAASSGGISYFAQKIAGVFVGATIKETITNIFEATATLAALSYAEIAMNNLTAAFEAIHLTSDKYILEALSFGMTAYLGWAKGVSALKFLFSTFKTSAFAPYAAVAGLALPIFALVLIGLQFTLGHLDELERLGLAAIGIASAFIGLYFSYPGPLTASIEQEVVPEPLYTSSLILPAAAAGTGVFTMLCIAAGSC